MIRIGVVGGTGYTGVELLAFLSVHPEVELAFVTSRQESGRRIDDLFPSLRGHVQAKFVDPEGAPLDQCDAVFFATPNGVAMKQAPALIGAGVRVIDLSADFRLRDTALYEQWYGEQHACPELLDEAVYGLPELNRERLAGARLIANPGCYPTAVQLGLLPAIEHDLVDTQNLIADTKSGVSGAGRKGEVSLSYAETSDSFKAYAVAGHRHQPEIVQGLSTATSKKLGLTFVPHLTPMIRGIHATLYAQLKNPKTDLAEIQALYEDRYESEPFVDVMPPNSCPDTRSVRGANVCRIALHRPLGGTTLVILSVEDNLVKGAVGQAIQNLNIAFGYPETTGLVRVPVVP